MFWFFVFFFVSGFCGILYELVWLRLAMAQFGVTTALVSIVLSMFMAGLGGGSWAAGKLVRRYDKSITFAPLRLYALAELLIGCSALLVPVQLLWGHALLEWASKQATMGSASYYLISGTWLALTLVPWCACMGATIPLAMFAIQSDARFETGRSFSFLYLANVLGGVAGAIICLGLIELYGFHGTLRVGAALNATICVVAFCLTFASRSAAHAPSRSSDTAPGVSNQGKSTLLLLFTTGLVSLGMEVIWIRLFTPYIGPVVYSFAMVLVAYLLATFAGAQVYRWWSRRHNRESELAWICLAVLGLLPLLTADSRVPLHLVVRVFLGVMPFSGVIGFFTPMLVDRMSAGDPDRAGKAYAVNVLGCILGPLLSGFILLPLVGEHVSMLLFVLPWLVMVLRPRADGGRQLAPRAAAYGLVVSALAVFFLTKSYETQFAHREVRRDYTATVIATGEGMQKHLLVNGTGMTSLDQVTKMMAHLTLSSLDQPPRDVLVICFGMGTTYRSVISWGVPATVVELVPSVPRLFSYYHADAAQVLASPFSHVVVDDGRRYLERSAQQYDAIVIDPPPPVQTAGSSLLYSRDFYTVAKERLRPGGILQQWLPEGDNAVQASVARSLKESFPYLRIYRSVGHGGWHFLASSQPIPVRTGAELMARMPATAVGDMTEWDQVAPAQQFDRLLVREMTPDQMIALSPGTPALQDDRPINEYFLLRTPFDELMSMEDEAH
jgi:spermidine synthase